MESIISSSTRGAEAYWTTRAGRLALRINIGWWFQRFVPWASGGCVLSALALLVLRPMQMITWPVAVAAGAWTLLCAVWAWWSGRHQFVGLEQALARLDDVGGLHNRLISARNGVGSWPPPPSIPPSVPSWNLHRILGPLIAGLALFLIAARIPYATPEPEAPRVIQEPTAWTTLDQIAERLLEEEVIEEKAVEAMREQVEALRNQPTEQWYRQSSMEASDHLREKVGQNLRALEQSMMQAAASLAMAAERRDSLSAAQKTELQELFEQAVAAMAEGELPLNGALLDQLKDIDLSNLTALTAEQLADIEKQLMEQSDCLSECAGQCDGQSEGQGLSAAAVAARADKAGSGGITRGPGEAPLTLDDATRAPLDAAPTPLSNKDLSRAALGDGLGTSDQRPETDPATYTGPSRAGAVSAEGTGGEAVWRTDATPAEQRVLKTYFD